MEGVLITDDDSIRATHRGIVEQHCSIHGNDKHVRIDNSHPYHVPNEMTTQSQTFCSVISLSPTNEGSSGDTLRQTFNNLTLTEQDVVSQHTSSTSDLTSGGSEIFIDDVYESSSEVASEGYETGSLKPQQYYSTMTEVELELELGVQPKGSLLFI